MLKVEGVHNTYALSDITWEIVIVGIIKTLEIFQARVSSVTTILLYLFHFSFFRLNEHFLTS